MPPRRPAVLGLTRELAGQWGRRGIRVNAIVPGWFDTEMTDGLFTNDKSAGWVRRNTMLGRGGEPRRGRRRPALPGLAGLVATSPATPSSSTEGGPPDDHSGHDAGAAPHRVGPGAGARRGARPGAGSGRAAAPRRRRGPVPLGPARDGQRRHGFPSRSPSPSATRWPARSSASAPESPPTGWTSRSPCTASGPAAGAAGARHGRENSCLRLTGPVGGGLGRDGGLAEFMLVPSERFLVKAQRAAGRGARPAHRRRPDGVPRRGREPRCRGR